MNLKARIAQRQPLWGTFLKTPSPILVEVLATADVDVLCLDAEHAPFDRRDIDLCVMAARARNLPVLVRPPSSAADHILNALDCGADGVLVPHVRTAADARAAVAATHFGGGGRGYAGSTRAAGYGRIGIEDHRRNSAERSVAILQIEDAEALDAIEAIAATPGIDALFVGRIDLTIALGASSPDDARVVGAVDRIVQAAVMAQVPVGMFVPRDAEVAHWRSKGATLFLQGSDHLFMRAGARAARNMAGF